MDKNNHIHPLLFDGRLFFFSDVEKLA